MQLQSKNSGKLQSSENILNIKENERSMIEVELRNRVDQLSKLQIGREHFVSAIKKFMEMQTLTAPLLQELIDHIDVFEAEGFGKNKTQRIVIYYRFVGYLDLPDTIPQDNYREDTRQGVAIEYVTDKPQPDAADVAS